MIYLYEPNTLASESPGPGVVSGGDDDDLSDTAVEGFGDQVVEETRPRCYP